MPHCKYNGKYMMKAVPDFDEIFLVCPVAD